MNWHRTIMNASWAVIISSVSFLAWLYYLPLEVDPGD